MKWRKARTPIIGEIRTIKRFAWLPTTIEVGDTWIVWLSYYNVKQIFVQESQQLYWTDLSKSIRE